MPLELARWPEREGVVWLVPPGLRVARPDVFGFDQGGMSFIDLLSSCDALLTKPGYGSFTEASCNGVPVLYLERPDWPETPHLADWLRRHNRATAISPAQLADGDLHGALEALWGQPAPPRPVADGAEQASRAVLGLGALD